jgi:hypothetical protein
MVFLKALTIVDELFDSDVSEAAEAAKALATMQRNCKEFDETPIGKMSASDIRRLDRCRGGGFIR